jgi:poly(A) polymerase Pap1
VLIFCGISCNISHAASIEEDDPLDDQLIKELYDNSKSNSTEEENHRDGKVLKN